MAGKPLHTAKFPVVGLGASAGGLEACARLLAALPADTGMAFILVQHLDPNHESMLVGLLSGKTRLTVRQAAEGMPVEREHLYVIPPGTYLSIGNGALHLSPPQARHGARLPFDFLLHSMAAECGALAICVVLSGTGADGSLGLQAVRRHGGLVIAQDLDEAGFDGMPRSAAATGAVDLVLPTADIPRALLAHVSGRDSGPVPDSARSRAVNRSAPGDAVPDKLTEIIELARQETGHDFTLYKRGTLLRRTQRRMALLSIAGNDLDRYLGILRNDANELGLLAKDLLINVTGFFRDAPVYDALAETTAPELVRQAAGRSLRVWIAGCSTGEEAYSLAILFHEQIAASQSRVKLQVFASDVDPDAVAVAREGRYPETIAAEMSPARLARFFCKDEHGYRVMPELRAAIVFTVQDLLTDPPFSRLDFVSCRNLMIYLGPEAQSKLIALFHFALREAGVLLLGGAETVGDGHGRFEVISKAARLYRSIGPKRPGAGFTASISDAPPARTARGGTPSRSTALAELCRRLVLDLHAPAAVLSNSRHECLYSLGPIERYLSVAPGHPTHDVLAMARGPLRTRLRSAFAQSAQSGTRVVAAGGRTMRNGQPVPFSIDMHPVEHAGEALLLICFVDEPAPGPRRGRAVAPDDAPRVAELEHELDAARAELQASVHTLELSGEEQRAINEEALSVNEEVQSTNEELLTSKEELQSLNEELNALNSQLQETLERQRTTSNDLQNVLYSTDVATLFLDTDLAIRFFTPATRSVFNLIPGDVGRPLADLRSLAADATLAAEARAVLDDRNPVEREIEVAGGGWFMRRILPYRTHGNEVEGVVITFTDITERKAAARALEAARHQADRANASKSRFLAAASHDLRQPLQTLALLQSLLAKAVDGDKARRLVARLDQTLGSMSGMLDTLLDINQIEAGIVRAEMTDFPIAGLLARLRDEYAYQAQAKGLELRLVPSAAWVNSDPRLLEQMLRNVLSNALKYTQAGRVLLGCRRRGDRLGIEVWDTGIGIPDGALETIFEEYRQLDNDARERSRGLGLGLSIVQRLASLLGHQMQVRSRPGKGSVFAIDVVRSTGPAAPAPTPAPAPIPTPTPAPILTTVSNGVAEAGGRTGSILVVEDDPVLRELLELLLTTEGHRLAVAPDGPAALAMVAAGTARPDLILADYNLPGGLDGLQATARLRDALRAPVPVIILTGDISASTLRNIAAQDCMQLSKPVKGAELAHAIQRLLPAAASATPGAGPPTGPVAFAGPVIFVVDDDSHVRAAIRSVLEEDGRVVEDYPTCEAFLAAYQPGRAACLLIDASLPGMGGFELLRRLAEAGHQLPAIMITGFGDVPMAVRAMKAGALDFIEKPVGAAELLASVAHALEQSRDASSLAAWRGAAAAQVAGLTARQRQVMDLVLAGHPSKNIAADLGVSQRTVENHRASIMRKTKSKSLPALARLALAAAWSDSEAAAAPGAVLPGQPAPLQPASQ